MGRLSEEDVAISTLHLVVYCPQLGFWQFLFIRYDAVNLSVITIKPNFYQVIIMILISRQLALGGILIFTLFLHKD